MAKLRSDSPLCRRIVLAFLDFIRSVEPAPGVDLEGLDVVKDCLEDVFMLDTSSCNGEIQPGLLADFFRSLEVAKPQGFELDSMPKAMECTPCTASASQQTEHKDLYDEQNASGAISKDELFGKFYAALDKSNFFMSSQGEIEDPAQVAKATHFFDDAYKVMEKPQLEIFNLSNLAEALKSKGNESLQRQLYSEAIDLYTCAIALSEKNAVYYCNRAAAYTHIHKYAEAIQDCLKSIEIDPSYSKAYSRLGLAYYAQGKYDDALNKGFLKALQLDPDNNSIRENIQVAQKKLLEQHRQAESDRNTRASQAQAPHSQPQAAGSTYSGSSFTSFSMNAPLSPDFANILRNMTASVPSHGQEPESNNNVGMNGGTNLNLNQLPGHVSDVLGSVMRLFSSQLQPQDNNMHPHPGRDGGDQT
ncbi:hypothetical protein J5N97_022415 [Dioscorea zingiberensis]|uniref:Small glutamine-rich tetratricopeptide repeat-containing protein n=1 Tax=Dioscorea zingiberensis TaxID=325984 RepID=A0A9D5CAC2_9LILI|nr:hypothetical protein J5N97_022415 [Dioscorea zingiberensis]